MSQGETPIYQGRDADGRFSAGDKPPPPPPPSEEGAVASGYQPPKLPPTCDNQCAGRIRSLQKQYGVRPDQAHDMYEREKQRRQRAERDAEESEEKHLRALEAQEKELAEAEKTLSAQGAADAAKEILLPQDKLDWALLLGGMVTKIPKGGKTLYKIANKGKALEEIRKKRQALNAEIKAGRARKGAVVEKKAAKRMKEHDVECFKKGKSNKATNAEYDRQLADQEKALNQMSVRDYEKARDLYKQRGRHPEAAEATAKYREKFQQEQQEKIRRQKIDNGMSMSHAKAEAAKEAADLMNGLDALHAPDLVAGGGHVPNGMGDASANRSIGGQWPQKGRVDGVDQAAKEAARELGGDAQMNVKLKRCK